MSKVSLSNVGMSCKKGCTFSLFLIIEDLVQGVRKQFGCGSSWARTLGAFQPSAPGKLPDAINDKVIQVHLVLHAKVRYNRIPKPETERSRFELISQTSSIKWIKAMGLINCCKLRAWAYRLGTFPSAQILVRWLNGQKKVIETNETRG